MYSSLLFRWLKAKQPNMAELRNRNGPGPRDSAPALSRDLAAARTAFDSNDAAASARAHSTGIASAASPAYSEPGHGEPDSSVLKCFSFAAFEGLSAALAILAAGISADVDRCALSMLDSLLLQH